MDPLRHTVAPLAGSALVLALALALLAGAPVGRTVELPRIRTSILGCGGARLPISITRSDALWLDQERLPDLETLRRRLDFLQARKRLSPLIIADAELPFGAVSSVIAATRTPTVALAARPENPR
jgi:hypothetical protein